MAQVEASDKEPQLWPFLVEAYVRLKDLKNAQI